MFYFLMAFIAKVSMVILGELAEVLLVVSKIKNVNEFLLCLVVPWEWGNSEIACLNCLLKGSQGKGKSNDDWRAI